MHITNYPIGEKKRLILADIVKARLTSESRFVTVPVASTKSQVVFDITKTLTTIAAKYKQTLPAVRAALGIVAAADNFTNDKQLLDMIKEVLSPGDSDDDQTQERYEAITQDITRELRRFIMRGVVGPLLFESVLEVDRESGGISPVFVDASALQNFDQLLKIVQSTQTLYSEITMGKLSDTIVSTLSGQLEDFGAYTFLRDVYSAFNYDTGATMNLKESYVRGLFEEAIWGKQLIKEEEITPVYIRKLTGINLAVDLNFAELMAAYVLMVQLLQGNTEAISMLQKEGADISSPDRIDNVNVVRLKNIALEMIWRVGRITSVSIPAEAGSIDMEKVRLFIHFLWVNQIISYVISGVTSSIPGKIFTQISTLQIRVDDRVLSVFKRIVSVTGMVYDSFCDVGAIIYTLIQETGYYQPGITKPKREVLMKFFEEQLTPLRNIMTNTSNARFLMSPTHILNRTNALPTYSPIEPMLEMSNIVPDKVAVNRPMQVSYDGDEWCLLASDVISGAYLEVLPSSFPINPLYLNRFLQHWSPNYVVRTSLPDGIMNNSLLKATIRFVSPAAIAETGYFKEFSRYAEMITVVDEWELSKLSGLPVTLTKKIFEDLRETNTIAKLGGFHLLLDYSNLKDGFMLFDSQILPFYDVHEIEDVATDPLNNRIFVAKHPSLSIGTYEPMNNMVKLLIGDGGVRPTPLKTVIKPSSPTPPSTEPGTETGQTEPVPPVNPGNDAASVDPKKGKEEGVVDGDNKRTVGVVKSSRRGRMTKDAPSKEEKEDIV